MLLAPRLIVTLHHGSCVDLPARAYVLMMRGMQNAFDWPLPVIYQSTDARMSSRGNCFLLFVEHGVHKNVRDISFLD